MATILSDVKKVLGIAPEFDDFDIDILLHVNSAVMTAEQLGVNHSSTEINAQTSWDYFTDVLNVSALRTWLCLMVRLAFDPPATSFQTNAIEKQLEQLSWRINQQVESK